MAKTAVNRCPVCGGRVYIVMNAPVGIDIDKDGEHRATYTENETRDMVRMQIHYGNPYECRCYDCGREDFEVKLVRDAHGVEQFHITYEWDD